MTNQLLNARVMPLPQLKRMNRKPADLENRFISMQHNFQPSINQILARCRLPHKGLPNTINFLIGENKNG
ncbi:hypothetical protein C0081_13380 [Cohaesibacter celericrescens]|uniref:Uncharacterized protein n=1 Tax=Cohaesibacter celericrescens TaxID=2067669 RepID=A0A2N5XRA1_9HYPH|nr:hypothetical protein C0081_13380 [Cohaesibacter celericrescens]